MPNFNSGPRGSSWSLTSPDYRYPRFPVTTDALDPTLRIGDILVVDLEKDRITRDAIYMVAYEGNPRPRRASLDLKTGDIMLCCDHPAYQSERIPADQVLRLVVIGRVVARLRRT